MAKRKVTLTYRNDDDELINLDGDVDVAELVILLGIVVDEREVDKIVWAD